MPLTDAALDRILQNVGARFVPSTLDQSALRKKIDFASMWYKVARLTRASETRREKRLHQIAKTAKRLLVLLAQEKGLLLGEWNTLAKESLEYVVGAAESRLVPTEPPAWGAALLREFNECSPFQWLAGRCLADIFEKHFEREARFSRDASGQPSGPYVRFVRQVLVELGITNRGAPYSNEAIAHALTGRARKVKQHD